MWWAVAGCDETQESEMERWEKVAAVHSEWMRGGRGHVWVERRDSPAAGTDATLVRLHFPPPNGTEPANFERVSAPECVNITTRQPASDEMCSHTFLMSPTQSSSAALLSFTVLACSETSAAGLTPHCSKKKKVM